MALDIEALEFQAPIPGMSLMTESKGRPWERPARYSDPEEALGFYLKQFSVPRRIAQTLEILEVGYPLAGLVDSLIINGVMQGVHSIDTAVIIAPAIFELLKGVADSVDIDYDDGLTNKNAPTDASLVAKAMKRMPREADRQVEIEEEDIAKIEQAVSLMSKPVKIKAPAEEVEELE